MLQRFFDIIISILALILLAPFLFAVVCLLKVTGEGEIFYVQDRIGKSEKPFGLIKFATMIKNSPNMSTGTITLKNDPRVLPFGKFLRRSKINELPQILNILKGDMSLIGPRPLTLENYNSYTSDEKSLISLVKPGLSGIGSIIFRDEEALLCNESESLKIYSEVIAPYKAALECWYVRHNTIMNYFLLIVLTIYIVCRPRSQLVWHIFPDLPYPPKNLKMLGVSAW